MNDKIVKDLKVLLDNCNLNEDERLFINNSIEFFDMESLFYKKYEELKELSECENLEKIARELNNKKMPLIYHSNYIVKRLKDKGYNPSKIESLKEKILFCSSLILLERSNLPSGIEQRVLGILSKNVNGVLVPKKHFFTVVAQYELISTIVKITGLEGFEKYLTLRDDIISRSNENIFDKMTINCVLSRNMFNIVNSDTNISDGEYLEQLKLDTHTNEVAQHLISLLQHKKLRK